MATIDDIINGSFGAIGVPIPRQAMPGMFGRGLPLDAASRLPHGSAGIDPMGWTPPTGPAWNEPTELDLAAIDKWSGGMSGDTGSMLAMFTDSPVNPAVAAATGAGNPAVTNVQGTMLPRRSGGGFLEMLFGPSKNGMDGLPGLLGGPGAGGILGMLGGQDDGAAPRSLPRKSTVNHKAARDAAERSGQTVSGTPSKHGRYYNSDTNTWM